MVYIYKIKIINKILNINYVSRGGFINQYRLATIIIIIIALFGSIFGINIFSNDSNNNNFNNISSNVSVVEDGQYCSADEVSAYIKNFHKLPSNYITKDEAHSLGWKGGSLKEYAPGKSIGGDVFTNRQGILPHSNKEYIECDIDANGTSRGAKRIVYSTENYKVYYTEDHYESFTQI